MAFKTLAQLRAVLNDELGLINDADNSFGTTAQRNLWIARAIAQMWPQMGRLTRETLTTVLNQQDYTLTTLYDVERVEVMDLTNPGNLMDRVKGFQHYLDETGDPPVSRMLIPKGVAAGYTYRLIGYAPYTVPAVDGDTLNVPPRLEWIVTAGARVGAYRFKTSQMANFERFQNENRQNALTPADLMELLRQAIREYGQGMQSNARNLTGAKTAMLKGGV